VRKERFSQSSGNRRKITRNDAHML
jgi:hypothetical protein